MTDTGPGIPGRASDEEFRHAPVEIPIDPPAENVGAMMPSARKTALAEQVCDSEWGRHAGGLTDTYADRLPTVIATLFHSLSCSRI